MKIFWWNIPIKTKEEKLLDTILKRACPECESRRLKVTKFYFRTIASCPRCKTRYELTPHKNPTRARKVVPKTRSETCKRS